MCVPVVRPNAALMRVDILHSAIQRASRVAEAEPEELSYSDRDDIGAAHLMDMQLMEPDDPRSEHEALWLTMIGEKLVGRQKRGRR